MPGFTVDLQYFKEMLGSNTHDSLSSCSFNIICNSSSVMACNGNLWIGTSLIFFIEMSYICYPYRSVSIL